MSREYTVPTQISESYKHLRNLLNNAAAVALQPVIARVAIRRAFSMGQPEATSKSSEYFRELRDSAVGVAVGLTEEVTAPAGTKYLRTKVSEDSEHSQESHREMTTKGSNLQQGQLQLEVQGSPGQLRVDRGDFSESS